MSSTTSPSRNELVPRPGRLDLILTLIVSAAGLYLAYLNYHDGPTAKPSDGGPVHLSVIGIPAYLMLTAPLLWRTSAPRVALALTAAAMVVYWAIFGPIVHCGTAYPTAALLAYAVGRRLSGADRLTGLTLATVAVVAIALTDALDPGTLVLGGPLALIGFGIGVGVAKVDARLRRKPAPVRAAAGLREPARLRENAPA